ncbi:HET-domain-containing protein [Mollisia scopiformis]|uniref:HET-domain-containing protein n=1 Tax=Mollisia scopiformis TaxID=149040 RepID=A0A194WS98_MOLSC|nr:HET-domain-containing protein [Mollisia scopiformis]KUJ10846.1 HET-domain-containing protein [Mollisia scopiformis]
MDSLEEQTRSAELRCSKPHYSPLHEDQDEIRLISIQQSNSNSSLVRCEVVTVSLAALTPEYQAFLSTSVPNTGSKRDIKSRWARLHVQKPEDTSEDIMDRHIPIKSNYRFTWGDYAALSYTWGDPTPTRQIVVNNQDVSVGQSLEIALRAISTRPDFQDGFMLWVDAICINQDDFEERGCQVGKMREIYGGAWTVIAWLGEEQDDSDEAFKLVQTLSEVDVDHGEQLAAKLLDHPEYLGFGCWVALRDLMSKPYWYRLWIIQELVLGSSSLVLRCGNHFITWTSFCQGIVILYDYLWTVKNNLLSYELCHLDITENKPRQWLTTSLHLVHQDLWALSHCEEQGRAHLPFDRLLNVANSANSRDARDKVYGLVGMMDPIIAKQIVPNYESPPAVIYASVAKTFIETYNNLEPLREGNPWSWYNTPSWTADWTWDGRLRHRNPQKNDLWGPFWTRKGPPEMIEPATPYRASGNTAPIISFSNNNLYLTCRGFIIDKIAALSARGDGYFDWDSTSISQPTHSTNAYGTPEGVAKALYTALILDRVADGRPAEARHSAILSLPSPFSSAVPQFRRLGWKWLAAQEGYYFRYSKWRRANQPFLLFGQPLDSYFSEEIPEGVEEYDYTEVYSCFDRTCKGRRFMTTEKRHLGWAPDNVFAGGERQCLVGDQVVGLFGCSTPLVVRERGEGLWLVVGEAYVQGMMEGESLEGLRGGAFEMRDFTFC